MEIKRRPFQGVLNILSFNRHFYVYGLIALAVLFFSRLYFNWPMDIFWLIVIAFAYGLLMPLIVSAYVYDFSHYYELKWLEDIVKNRPTNQVVNINAGFDETSFILHKKMPLSHLKVFDFYDVHQHTEAAIVRARKVSLIYPGTTQISTSHIPMENDSVDLIFLLSAAHEIRSNKEKVLFLKECHRICKTGGQVIMVEHLRDFPNFLAFTIGFTHFFSRHTWRTAFAEAGFSAFREKKFTPFMSVFEADHSPARSNP
ncbi:MAG: methyltransferase domain-containing protein [Sphingobacteriales bacterium]|nr:MAG: methyltransferase domain-containing protein [Sphingobacteriales bacterium]